MKNIFLAMAAGLTTMTCGSITDSTPPGDIIIAFDEEFSLAVGQGAWTPDSVFGVRFVAVPNDSRCAADVVCVWEGFAEISLDVSVAQTSHEATLSTNPAVCCTADTTGAFVVEIRGLDPEPRTDRSDIPYEVRLLVGRIPEG